MTEGFKDSIRRGTPVDKVESFYSDEDGKHRVRVYAKGSYDDYDYVVMATHAPDTLRLLGDSATDGEKRLLGEFKYKENDVYLHRDLSLMPKQRDLWSSWNFMGDTSSSSSSSSTYVYCSYYENQLQSIPEDEAGVIVVTLNPPKPPAPELTIARWSASHPIPTVASYHSQLGLDEIQGKRGIYFAGAYLGWGFHEDGCKAGLHAAALIAGERFTPLPCVPAFSSSMSWTQTGARLLVTNFLSNFVKEGVLELREIGGAIYRFGQKKNSEDEPVVVEVLSPEFYTCVARRYDLGFADAFIEGFVKCDLYRFFVLLINNRDNNNSSDAKDKNGSKTKTASKSLITTTFDSWMAWKQHRARANTQDNTRKNISAHYDLSNDLFSLFLDPTMCYSCAYFESPSQDLEDAQKRKMELLCEKAQVKEGQRVLEIGSGWGSLAIHLAKTRGCEVVGLTLSQEQKKFAEERVRREKLEHRVRFELVDYRAFVKLNNKSSNHKFDRIISCEMLEAVGAEFYDDFFSCLEQLLVPEGLVVLQYIAIPDQRFDTYRNCKISFL